MKIAVFDTHRFERTVWDKANIEFGHELVFFEHRLTLETALSAQGFPVVCPFVNDKLDAAVIYKLKQQGVRLIALRSAGYNHVDLRAAASAGIPIVRVPAYSPNAVAEHAVTLILALNRKICRASARSREMNFSLEGLVGFDLKGKTVGLVGTGRIGEVMARIMSGFGCEVLATDPFPIHELMREHVVHYVDLDELLRRSDIISLHLPLSEKTRHMIDHEALAKMKPGVMLINTSRGALIDTKALIQALKTGQVGYAGLDVYEEEEGVFFNDLSDHVLKDDVLARLMTFPNVLVTSHQAFLTHQALTNIAETTLQNVSDFEAGKQLENQIAYDLKHGQLAAQMGINTQKTL